MNKIILERKPEIIDFNKKIQDKFNEISKSDKLFRSSLTGDQIWNLYLKSFKVNDNPIFRDPNSTEKNCNHCKNFMRRYGNIVSVDDNYNITTMFDIEIEGEFKNSAYVISSALKQAKIEDIFIESYEELNKLPYQAINKSTELFQLGVASNPKRYTKEEAEKYKTTLGIVKPNQIRTFNHIHLFLDKKYVNKSEKSIEAIIAKYRDDKNVFKRALDSISLDTLTLVRDLINQNSLLDGQTHLYKIEAIIPLKTEYDKLNNDIKDNWCWIKSYDFQFAKFRNELIGVLCSELSEGEELNKACQSWNKRVDPVNYMKTTAPITKKQIEEAKKFVEDNGYTESFNRRFATIDDIKVSEILHSNVGKNEIKSVSIFDNVKPTVPNRHKRSEFDKVEEISIDKFMKDVLPSCTSVEAFLTNNQKENLVSLTTANNSDSKPIFKWSNNYSWTFNGNLAGKSQIKENVKAVGGKITGVLRSSLQWNDEDTKGIVDLDLHCETPYTEISFRNKRDLTTKGWLDIDMINPTSIGIENVTWQDNLIDGKYVFYVHNFSRHTRHNGFKFEIEFDGNIYNYHQTKSFLGNVKIATITVKGGLMSIEHHLTESEILSKEIYGLETNQFHKVNLVCLSPNHWGDNNVGNKYYMFMLDKCKSPTSIRSFHNENLNSDLIKHKKVMEVLGSTNNIVSTDKQLSGLGFNATVKDQLIVKLTGTHKRVLKINFGN